MLDFLTELQTAKDFAALLKSDSTIDALPPILKIHRANKVNTYGGVSFRYSYRWVD